MDRIFLSFLSLHFAGWHHMLWPYHRSRLRRSISVVHFRSQCLDEMSSTLKERFMYILYYASQFQYIRSLVQRFLIFRSKKRGNFCLNYSTPIYRLHDMLFPWYMLFRERSKPSVSWTGWVLSPRNRNHSANQTPLTLYPWHTESMMYSNETRTTRENFVLSQV